MLRLLKTGIFLLISFVTTSAIAGDKPLTIGADQWCPFFCEKGQQYDGFSVELLQSALQLKGLDSKYITAPFNRVTRQVETGVWEIHGATDNIFTPNILIGKEPVAYSKWVFVVKKDQNWNYRGIKSLQNKRFGSISGYVYSQELTDYYTKIENKDLVFNISSQKPQSLSLKMLIAGRFDFIVEDESVVRYWANKLKLSDKIKFVGIDSEVAFYPGYKKNDSDALQLARKVDEAIRELKRNKKFMKEIIKKYNIAKWK